MVYNLYKERGETPLECIERFRDKNPELKKEKMSYLGRLDPLAEGVLVVANGSHTKKRDEFLALDKEYEFACIFGFATDTYDVMGKILKIKKVDDINELDLIRICHLYEGEREQEYPLYSSKTISSILAARKSSSSESPRISSLRSARLSSEDFSSQQNKMSGVKKIKIYKMHFGGLQILSGKELFGRILMDIGRVKGDFRQAEILNLWKDHIMSRTFFDTRYFLARFSAIVSSGTYIRGIVNDIGNTLGSGATTLSIKRTRVGDYKIKDSVKF